MKLMLLDTCGASASLALAESAHEPQLLGMACLPGRTAAECLLTAVRELMTEEGIVLQDLGAIAVVNGPGSFTGARVGVSAAKGLCEALGVPLIAVSRLAVLANGASQAPVQDGAERLVRAVLDAGRGEYYCGEYLDGACVREALLAGEDLLAAGEHQHGRVIVCEAAIVESLAALGPHLVAEPNAASAWPLVLRRLHEEAFDDVATVDANYVRRSDAEIFAKPTARAATPKAASGRTTSS